MVEQDFHEHFRVNVTWFFTFFTGVLDRIVLILERSRHFAHVSGHGSAQAVTGGAGANGLIKYA